MTTSNEVKKVLLELQETFTVKRLIDDELFQMTVAEQYDEYIKEYEYIGESPNWDLESFVIDKVEQEEENN